MDGRCIKRRRTSGDVGRRSMGIGREPGRREPRLQRRDVSRNLFHVGIDTIRHPARETQAAMLNGLGGQQGVFVVFLLLFFFFFFWLFFVCGVVFFRFFFFV